MTFGDVCTMYSRRILNNAFQHNGYIMSHIEVTQMMLKFKRGIRIPCQVEQLSLLH